MKQITLLLVFLLVKSTVFSQDKIKYQLPPNEIREIIDAPPTPFVSMDPRNKWMMVMERPSFPPIEELAQPELRLAGLRINPGNNGRSRSFPLKSLKFLSIDGKKEILLKGLPENSKIENTQWSPDGKKIAFTLNKKTGIELWVAFAETGETRQLTGEIISDIMYSPCLWLSDSKHLVYKSIPENRGNIPQALLVPEGPNISESSGKKAPVRTYQDLLKNESDEKIFAYYGTSRLHLIDLEKNDKLLGDAGIITAFSPSPDGKYLLVQSVKKPFSYLVPYSFFPLTVEIWDMTGKSVRQVADLPLAEDIPKGFNAVRKGARSFSWRSDKPATLYWVEAQDEGDPNKEASVRDKLFYLEAPFQGDKKESVSCSLRYGGVTWGNDETAILHESWWKTRKAITSRFMPGNNSADKKVIFDRSYEDRYNDPGDFVTAMNEYGKYVLLSNDNGTTCYLEGEGASPEGNRPFIDKINLSGLKTTRMWRSEAPYYEEPLVCVDLQKELFITRRESTEEVPNYFLRDIKSKKLTQLTKFEHPYPQMKSVKKQLLKYKRKDGVQLSGMLYLPPGYKQGEGPLPVLMWAYPQEFKSSDAAGQVSESPYRFTRIFWGGALPWLTQGYAILDDPSMPIVGEGDKEPNDTYIEQLVASAEAAVDTLVKMGVGDRKRMAIGGHSYGAFMTANLLAHSDLFATGIARSGAYNRTLTPFGFQAEERTLWDAPETYSKMSPFNYANKVNEPILIIHGEADNNPGTFTLQSERFFGALKGHGTTARMVLLPHESHGYQARESVMHVLWEMNEWLNKHVKNRKE